MEAVPMKLALTDAAEARVQFLERKLSALEHAEAQRSENDALAAGFAAGALCALAVGYFVMVLLSKD